MVIVPGMIHGMTIHSIMDIMVDIHIIVIMADIHIMAIHIIMDMQDMDGIVLGIVTMLGVILTMDIGEYITLIMVILALLTTGATLQEVLGISQGQEHIMTMVSQVIRLPVII